MLTVKYRISMCNVYMTTANGSQTGPRESDLSAERLYYDVGIILLSTLLDKFSLHSTTMYT